MTRRGYHYQGQPGPLQGNPLPGRSSRSGSGDECQWCLLQANPEELPHPRRRLASCLRSEARPALRVICAVLLLLVIYSRPASCEVPEGTWLLANRVAIQVFDCSGLLCGKIVWLARPRTTVGRPDVDHLNPDPKLRQRPLCGLTILWGLPPNGPGHWRSLPRPHRNTDPRSPAELAWALLSMRTSLRRRFAVRARKRGPERSDPPSFSLIHFIRGGVPSGSNIDRITAT